MPIETRSDNCIIDITIESIGIKGQHTILAAPIYLSGHLNISKLSADYQTAGQLPLQIGVDEAGRGPLLGSVNVAAAILTSAWSGSIEEQPLLDTPLSILTDSKKLSEKKRDALYPLVQKYAIGYIVAEIPAAVIDQINILQATMLGMRLCTEALLARIVTQVNTNISNMLEACNNRQVQVLYDGNRCPELDYAKLTNLGVAKSLIDCQAWVKGDARHSSIAAASILAKVSRDQKMYQLDVQYPQYGIAKHKGYPTRMHMQAIEEYGILSEHRRSFSPVRQRLDKDY